jgi:hypothetical protein
MYINLTSIHIFMYIYRCISMWVVIEKNTLQTLDTWDSDRRETGLLLMESSFKSSLMLVKISMVDR